MPGSPEPRVWANEPQPGENKIFAEWIWESANENASHFISVSMSRCRAMILSFLGPSGTFHSLWDTVYDRGGSARLEHAQGRRARGRKILGFGAQRVTEDGAAQLEVRLFGWWLYTLKGLCVPGGHRSRTDGAHRRAGLEGLWERASKHVEPPTSESDKRGKSPGNGRLHFFHRPQRFTSLVRGWSW